MEILIAELQGLFFYGEIHTSLVSESICKPLIVEGKAAKNNKGKKKDEFHENGIYKSPNNFV
jgi:hypothetical protein